MMSDAGNIRRNGDRVVIPVMGPQFPAVCLLTGETENLVWIDQKLSELPVSRRSSESVSVLTSLMLPIVGLFAGYIAYRKSEPESDLPDYLAPDVKVAVEQRAYEEWRKKYTNRKWLAAFLRLIGVGGIIGGIAFGVFVLADNLTMNLMLGGGFVLTFVAWYLRRLLVRPILHSIISEPGGFVTVLGASAEFRQQLDLKPTRE